MMKKITGLIIIGLIVLSGISALFFSGDNEQNTPIQTEENYSLDEVVDQMLDDDETFDKFVKACELDYSETESVEKCIEFAVALKYRNASVCSSVDTSCQSIVKHSIEPCNDFERPLEDVVWCYSNYAIYFENENYCIELENVLSKNHNNYDDFDEGSYENYCLDKYSIGEIFQLN